MPYRQLEHTADLCFEVSADSFAELLGEVLRAMMEWGGPVWGSADGSWITILLMDI